MSLMFFGACNLPDQNDILNDVEYAIPVINSKIKLADLIANDEFISIQTDNEGNLKLIYTAPILQQTIGELLPSIPSVGEIPLLDTISRIPLLFDNGLVIKRAIFKGDEMRFRYTGNIEEDIYISMIIPELTKDGVTFQDDFVLEYKGSLPFTAFTPSRDLAGYEFISEDNTLTLIYQSKTANGSPVSLGFAAVSFNELVFLYGEGSVERSVFKVDGTNIPVNIYNAWKQGTLEFENPIVTFEIEHSYGFPVSLRINALTLQLIDGSIRNLSGIFVNSEIPLDYPGFDAVGSSQSSVLVFDKSNSNINTLFNEKVTSISYDLDAVLNPSNNKDLGYVTDDSFFNLDVRAEVPLKLKIKDLILSDTFNIDGLFEQSLKQVELKIITANSYPVDLSLDVRFLDDNNTELFRLFGDDILDVEAGSINMDGTTQLSEEKIRFVKLNEEEVTDISNATKVVITPGFDFPEGVSEFLGIRPDQYLEVRIGAKIKL